MYCYYNYYPYCYYNNKKREDIKNLNHQEVKLIKFNENNHLTRVVKTHKIVSEKKICLLSYLKCKFYFNNSKKKKKFDFISKLLEYL